MRQDFLRGEVPVRRFCFDFIDIKFLAMIKQQSNRLFRNPSSRMNLTDSVTELRAFLDQTPVNKIDSTENRSGFVFNQEKDGITFLLLLQESRMPFPKDVRHIVIIST